MFHLLCAKWRVWLALVSCAILFPSTAQADTVRHGDRSLPQVAVTIDDCYDSAQVLAAIELCETYQIPVTFFPIGSALKYDDAALWQRALDAGCEIGNHTWGHKDLTTRSAQVIRFQLLRTQQKLDEMLGYHYLMQVMRPPYGSTNAKVAQAVASVGYNWVVKWDVSQTNAAQALKDTQNGSILLYHARSRDISCLETLIPQLLSAGYELVTVSDLLGLPPVTPTEGIYTYEAIHARQPSTLPQ